MTNKKRYYKYGLLQMAIDEGNFTLVEIRVLSRISGLPKGLTAPTKWLANEIGFTRQATHKAINKFLKLDIFKKDHNSIKLNEEKLTNFLEDSINKKCKPEITTCNPEITPCKPEITKVSTADYKGVNSELHTSIIYNKVDHKSIYRYTPGDFLPENSNPNAESDPDAIRRSPRFNFVKVSQNGVSRIVDFYNKQQIADRETTKEYIDAAFEVCDAWLAQKTELRNIDHEPFLVGWCFNAALERVTKKRRAQNEEIKLFEKFENIQGKN